jgi:vancomycin resistance protein YoaR
MVQLEKQNKSKIISVVILIIAIIIGLIYIFLLNHNMNVVVEKKVFYNNVFVENDNLGGLSKEEAKRLIKDKYLKPLYDKKIIFAYNNSTWVVSYTEFDVNYNIDEVIEQAYNIARSGKTRDRYDQIMDLELHPKKFNLEYSFDKNKLEKCIKTFEKNINIDMVNSKFQRVDGAFTGTDEQIGKKLNIEKSLELAMKFVGSKKEGKIDLVVEEIVPDYTKAYFSRMNNSIGSFSTTISKGTEGRYNNIKLAASKINGSLIYPGEVFSTNKALGDTTVANGYMLAPIILNGKLEDGIGGGVCQVSSTLYNAVIYSELEIVERQCHSRPVGYVDKGRDATLAWDYLDFKFKNSTEYPIYIESSVENNRVNVCIYGFESHMPNRKLYFESVVTEVIFAPEDNIIEDPTLDVGARIYVSTPKEGYKVKVYKSIYEGNKLMDKILLSTNTYKPTRGELKIGTKK